MSPTYIKRHGIDRLLPLFAITTKTKTTTTIIRRRPLLLLLLLRHTRFEAQRERGELDNVQTKLVSHGPTTSDIAAANTPATHETFIDQICAASRALKLATDDAPRSLDLSFREYLKNSLVPGKGLLEKLHKPNKNAVLAMQDDKDDSDTDDDIEDEEILETRTS